MDHKFSIIAVLLAAGTLTLTGCGKKADDQLALNETGFEAISTTEELAQLPQQATGTTTQQAAIEILPVEASPVTQAVPAAASLTTSVEGLTYQQKIQTALKNAGLYNGKIDGKIGPASRRAIETFQRNNGLGVDGKVGPKTWAVLEAYLYRQASTETAPATQQ
ncbi:MAG: hypothetical protein MOGMAGMI_00519 [Candidatus Omnitrophica bacterium]|nr:hypothetical protein [Candidatus Omnitrophota bacterium]